jgi:hypothetical protein
MPSGPSRRLEAFVGLWIPPACREEVLGDLHEKYTGPWQYISLAQCVVPCVILSRIRRTTDAFVILTEALLVYGSFLAAAWYTDRTSLTGEWGFWRLGIPTVLNLALLILEHAWEFKTRWARPIINGVVISIGIYFNLSGELASLLLVWAVEILFRRGANVPQGAGGPALWLKHGAEPPVVSRDTKSLLIAGTLIILSAIVVASIGAKPGIVGMVTVLVMVWLGLGRSGKE